MMARMLIVQRRGFVLAYWQFLEFFRQLLEFLEESGILGAAEYYGGEKLTVWHNRGLFKLFG